jgi:hypothetical protein
MASLAVLSYLGAVGYVKLSEKTLIFRPGERRVGPSPSQFDLREKRLTYPSTDGVRFLRDIGPRR